MLVSHFCLSLFSHSLVCSAFWEASEQKTIKKLKNNTPIKINEVIIAQHDQRQSSYNVWLCNIISNVVWAHNTNL